jgi:hypothetical protein
VLQLLLLLHRLLQLISRQYLLLHRLEKVMK